MADDDMKPMRELQGKELEQIANAIVKGYRANTLSRILRFKWGVVLEDHVNVNHGFLDVVTDLIDWTERKGRTLELLKLAFAENPENPQLQQAAKELGISIEDARRKYDLDVPAERPASLEAAVNAQSRLINFELFQTRLPALGNRICRIETPVKKGTGFLVSPDRVLTNFHVVKELIENKSLEEHTVCRFDYRGLEGDVAPVGKPYKLAANGVLAKSPYSQSDLSGDGDPGPGELDYALLQLTEKVGNTPGSDNKERGWFNLVTESSVVAMRDFIVIAQHAEAQPLEIAWGHVVGFPAAGSRLRYDTTTEAGSSGSPCFTIDLNILALHHAAEPKNKPTYNQAVPLWLVARDLKANKIQPSEGVSGAE